MMSRDVEMVRFRIDGVPYVLPVRSVAAILDLTAMEHGSQGDQTVWTGWIKSYQSAIRVADGRRIYGGAGSRPSSARVIVLRSEIPVGIIVDEVAGSRVVPSGDVFDLPATAGSRAQILVSGAVWSGRELELWVDEKTLLDGLLNNEVALDPGAVPAVDYRLGEVGHEVLELEIVGSSDRWCVPVGVVRHVARFRVPQPMGRMPDDVLGLLSWQRQPIPLISVSGRFGLPKTDEASGQIVVVGEPEGQVLAALAVRQVHGIQSVVRHDGDTVYSATGLSLRRLDLNRLLSNGYRGESRATVLVSDPMPSTAIVT